jgi:putative phosphoesterase
MKLLILSDIHGNWPALEAVLRAEPRYDLVAFCGDVVDYGPCPVRCLRWVAENATHMVLGNHDHALASGADCRCLGTFREYSLATRAWHRTLLEETDLLFLRRMPVTRCFGWAHRTYWMAHADPHGDLFPYLTMDRWEGRVKGLDADVVLLGHTHVQGMRVFGKTTVVNPGSVGLARDRGGEPCYAVIEDGRVDLKRVAYPVERTVAALRKAPLPEGVIEGLAAVLTGARPSTPSAPP